MVMLKIKIMMNCVCGLADRQKYNMLYLHQWPLLAALAFENLNMSVMAVVPGSLT